MCTRVKYIDNRLTMDRFERKLFKIPRWKPPENKDDYLLIDAKLKSSEIISGGEDPKYIFKYDNFQYPI